jgi:dTMP kinase
MNPTGRFFVLEGPEGAGKSTLAAALVARFTSHGVTPVVVREPGGTPVAESIRAALLDPAREYDGALELLYFATARADLVARVIRPALMAGQIVLSDRFTLSTEAYQIGGRGVPADLVRQLNAIATRGLAPDLTLVLDVDPGVGASRQTAAGKQPDRMELETPLFHSRVAAWYRAATGPGVVHLDGGQAPSLVADAAWAALAGLLPAAVQRRAL